MAEYRVTPSNQPLDAVSLEILSQRTISGVDGFDTINSVDQTLSLFIQQCEPSLPVDALVN